MGAKVQEPTIAKQKRKPTPQEIAKCTQYLAD